MKVLALSNLYPPDVIGGYELACAQAVDGLLGRGHDVRVMTGAPRRPVPAVPHVYRDFRLSDIYNEYLLNNAAPVTRDIWQAEARYVCAHNVHALANMLDEFQPDVIYVWNVLGLGGLGVMAALDYLRYPWVWQLDDVVPLWLCEVGQRMNPALLRSLERVRGEFISMSSRLADRIRLHGFQFPGEVHYLPGWIIGEKPEPRDRYFQPGGPLRIINAGQIGTHKGIDLIIEAVARLRDLGYENVTADIFGHTTESSWQGMIHTHQLEGKVAMRGPLPQAELFKILPDYDVFAFPTHDKEPFGLAPLEALGQGCVPILSRECGVAEWLVHGVHCLKSEKSAESLAESLQAILDGEVALEGLAKRGSAAAWRDFHLDPYLDKLEPMFERVSTQSRAGAGELGDVYRLALLAEKLAHLMIHEAHVA